MVKKRTNVVHEQWIQLLGDLLAVGKIKCPIKGNPRKIGKLA